MYTPSAYSHFFLTRQARRGGRVSVLVEKSVECSLEHNFTVITEDYETVAVCSGAHVFVGLYRPSTGSFDKYCTFLEMILSFANENKFELVLGGDFNTNIRDNGLKQTSLSTLVALNGFDIICTGPTRITATSSTLLDFYNKFFGHIDKSRCYCYRHK